MNGKSTLSHTHTQRERERERERREEIVEALVDTYVALIKYF